MNKLLRNRESYFQVYLDRDNPFLIRVT